MDWIYHDGRRHFFRALLLYRKLRRVQSGGICSIYFVCRGRFARQNGAARLRNRPGKEQNDCERISTDIIWPCSAATTSMREMNQAAPINRDRQTDRPATRRPRVLLSACSFCPNWGSEPGVGWRRATEIARYCDVWVLTKKDGMEPRIAGYIEEHGPIPNLEFVYVPRQPWELTVAQNWPLKHIAYRRWLRRAYRVAERLHAEISFDIAHHVTFNGFREPSYLYKLGIPFVWGPVGGAQNYPWRFLRGAGRAGAALEATRSILNVVQLHTSQRVRAAGRSAAAIFAANPEN